MRRHRGKTGLGRCSEGRTMKRADVLGLLAFAGYHDDTAAFVRLCVEHRVSRAAAQEAYNGGRRARMRGIACGCRECKAAVTADSPAVAPAVDAADPSPQRSARRGPAPSSGWRCRGHAARCASWVAEASSKRASTSACRALSRCASASSCASRRSTTPARASRMARWTRLRKNFADGLDCVSCAMHNGSHEDDANRNRVRA